MIQIISAAPAGPDIQAGLAASPQGSPAATFMALFSRAITPQGLAPGDAGEDVLAALPGKPAGTPGEGLGLDGVLAVPADASADGSGATDQDVSLLSMLGLPFQVPTDAGKPTLQSLDASGLSDADGVDIDGRPTGKKLPNLLAVIAGQQKSARLQSQQEAAGAVLGKADPAGAVDDDSRLSGLAALATALTPDKAAAPLPAPGLVTVPVAGQEAAMLAVREPAAASPQSRLVLSMQSGFGTPGWQQELGDKLVWMSGRQGQMAELILNPPSLGAVEVRLHMSGAEASAQFFSANPNVRDVLEAALPKLREMMVASGVALGEATVSDHSSGQRERASQGATARQGGLSGGVLAEGGQAILASGGSATALLDYFA